jgi:hypothetical protein
MDKSQKEVDAKRDRRPWERPALKSIGTIADVVQASPGKLSISGGDPGEGLKPSGTG